jgi:hypothetical protein
MINSGWDLKGRRGLLISESRGKDEEQKGAFTFLVGNDEIPLYLLG